MRQQKCHKKEQEFCRRKGNLRFEKKVKIRKADIEEIYKTREREKKQKKKETNQRRNNNATERVSRSNG